MAQPNLEREIKTYTKRLPELSAQEGKFVLIEGEEVGGLFETYQDALKAGYEKYGIKPFLVKKISAAESLANFTRELDLCHT
jgi:hypothetical protein